MPNSQKFKPTLVLIALNIAFYIYTSVAGGNFLETSGSMIVLFVHANIAHIGGNMIFLLVFGLRSEEMFSLPEYLAIYFLGGLTGNILSLFLLPPLTPSVGASGAIFALFGGAAVYARRSVSQSIIGALIYAFFLLLLSSGPGVNIFAHLGGLGTGLLIGYLLAARRKPETRYTISYSYSPFP
jgi:membrane associated rhomboid family serine protease